MPNVEITMTGLGVLHLHVPGDPKKPERVTAFLVDTEPASEGSEHEKEATGHHGHAHGHEKSGQQQAAHHIHRHRPVLTFRAKDLVSSTRDDAPVWVDTTSEEVVTLSLTNTKVAIGVGGGAPISWPSQYLVRRGKQGAHSTDIAVDHIPKLETFGIPSPVFHGTDMAGTTCKIDLPACQVVASDIIKDFDDEDRIDRVIWGWRHKEASESTPLVAHQAVANRVQARLGLGGESRLSIRITKESGYDDFVLAPFDSDTLAVSITNLPDRAPLRSAPSKLEHFDFLCRLRPGHDPADLLLPRVASGTLTRQGNICPFVRYESP